MTPDPYAQLRTVATGLLVLLADRDALAARELDLLAQRGRLLEERENLRAECAALRVRLDAARAALADDRRDDEEGD